MLLTNGQELAPLREHCCFRFQQVGSMYSSEEHSSFISTACAYLFEYMQICALRPPWPSSNHNTEDTAPDLTVSARAAQTRGEQLRATGQGASVMSPHQLSGPVLAGWAVV